MLMRHEVEILLRAGHQKTEVARLTGMLGEANMKFDQTGWSCICGQKREGRISGLLSANAMR